MQAYQLPCILLATVCLCAILLTDVYADIRKWKNNEQINHGQEAKVRAILILVPGLLFFVATGNLFDHFLRTIIVVTLMIFFIYWLFFDGFYNLVRTNWLKRNSSTDRFGFFYTGGNEGKQDALLDRLMRPLPVWLRAVIKIGGTLLFIVLYILRF